MITFIFIEKTMILIVSVSQHVWAHILLGVEQITTKRTGTASYSVGRTMITALYPPHTHTHIHTHTHTPALVPLSALKQAAQEKRVWQGRKNKPTLHSAVKHRAPKPLQMDCD